MLVQSARASGVPITGLGVLATVDLDNELVGWNREVRNVAPDRVLAPDLDRKARGTQRLPQRVLRLRRIPA